jgi:hypothetical protein
MRQARKLSPDYRFVLTNGLSADTILTVSPTEDEVRQAVDDLTSGSSEFVILARGTAGYADNVQASAYLPDRSSRLECRIWLNSEYFEHYYLFTPMGTEYYERASDIKVVFLEWLRTGRVSSVPTIRRNH